MASDSPKQHLRYAALVIWALLLVVPASYFVVAHYIALPQQAGAAGDERLTVAAKALRARHGRPGEWLALHVVVAGCRCSAAVLDHLERRAGLGFPEHVVFVGHDAGLMARLDAKGISHEEIEPRALEPRLGLVAGPVLVVVDDQDRIRYRGGYTLRRDSPVDDAALVASVAAGDDMPARPVFGCAVSRSLQEVTDPLGLKYSTN